jgi:hypothetical protein
LDESRDVVVFSHGIFFLSISPVRDSTFSRDSSVGSFLNVKLQYEWGTLTPVTRVHGKQCTRGNPDVSLVHCFQCTTTLIGLLKAFSPEVALPYVPRQAEVKMLRKLWQKVQRKYGQNPSENG